MRISCRGPYPAFCCALALLASLFLPASRAQGEGRAVGKDPALRALILAYQPGNTPTDREIIRLQGKIRNQPEAQREIVQLGWAYVAKARLTGDPGFYKIAEQCAQLAAAAADSLLLRGHIDHALHRFTEAEAIARQLTVGNQTSWQTYALLGDALMEQGKLGAAVDAYQRMIDIRPCLQTYARVAHIRWLKGDLPGAEELMRLAVESGSSRDPEPAAWAYTRLALYQFQSREIQETTWSVDRALEFVQDYPAALFLRSKLEMARGEPAKAVESLRTACAQVPLPEYQWGLVDAAGLAGDSELAARTEEALKSRGATEDPRSFALFLGTRTVAPEMASKLAREELANRRDVLTYDAVAWTDLAAGRLGDAGENMKRALAEGTQDARLFYHAGKIAATQGQKKAARNWIQRAGSLQQMLLPSERADLTRQAAALGVSLADDSISQPTKPKLADTAIHTKQL